MRLIVERRVAIKELWEVSEPYDPETPLHLQGQRRAHGYTHLGPVTIRPYIEGEGLEPQADTKRSAERAEQGYWSRFMQYWRSR